MHETPPLHPYFSLKSKEWETTTFQDSLLQLIRNGTDYTLCNTDFHKWTNFPRLGIYTISSDAIYLSFWVFLKC